MMMYKGYVGRAEIDEEAGIIHGRVIGLRDVITFEGRTVDEAGQAFRDSVDDYIDFCKERGEKPEKPYSGNFQVRIGADLHRRLAMIAEAESISLNELVRRVATREISSRLESRSAVESIRREEPVPGSKGGREKIAAREAPKPPVRIEEKAKKRTRKANQSS